MFVGKIMKIQGELHMKNNQLEILRTIARFIEKNEISPTIRELCKLLNLKSTSTVHGHIMKLKELGVIENHETFPRTIKITEKGREILNAYEIIH